MPSYYSRMLRVWKENDSYIALCWSRLEREEIKP